MDGRRAISSDGVGSGTMPAPRAGREGDALLGNGARSSAYQAAPIAGASPLLPPLPVPAPRSPWRKRVDMIVAVLGASLVALLSGTPNSFNTISHKLEADLGESDAYVSFLTGLGVAGLQLSLPAGLLADNFDTTVACLASATAVVGGYVGMSYSSNGVLVILCYAAVGVGSGCTYLSALQTVINLGYALGIAVVSLCMSLSLSVTIAVTNGYANAEDCTGNECWRDYVRVYAACCAGAMYVGALGLVVANWYNGPQDEGAFERPRKISLDIEMPLWRTLRIFRKPFFLACFAGNLLGVGGGTLIVSTCRQMWRNFNDNPADADRNQTIMVMFSVFTGCGNVISPVVADLLHRRGILKRAHYCAVILFVEALLFCALGLITSVSSLRHGGQWVHTFYMVVMASIGLGFGTFLSTYPAILADVFGFRNFGSYMSFLQFGTACVAVMAPVSAAWVVNASGYYSPMLWGFGGLLVFAGIGMVVVPSTTQTYRPRPKGNKGKAHTANASGSDWSAGEHVASSHGPSSSNGYQNVPGGDNASGEPVDEISLPPSTPYQARKAQFDAADGDAA